MTACPMCAEDISGTEVTCPHCGSAIVVAPVVQPAVRVDGLAPNREASGASKRTKLLALVASVAILAGVAVVIAVKMGRSSTTGSAPTAPASPPVAAPTTLPPIAQNSAPPPPESAVTASPTPPLPAAIPALRRSDVEGLVKAQAASLTSTGAAFVESFDANAVAFFPHALMLYEGRSKIIDGSREAWGQQGSPDKVEASDTLIGIDGSIAWATALWKITPARSRTLLPVRVTEIITQDANGLRVIAASFSIPPTVGVAGIAAPVPVIVGGPPPAADSDTWLALPLELSKHIRNDDPTLIGSDAKEFAIGADESRKMLATWKTVKLEFAGNVRAIEGPGFRVVVGFVRWKRAKPPTSFRVLGLFVPGEVMAGPAPWELATAHYSVAIASVSVNPTAPATFTISIRNKDGGV